MRLFFATLGVILTLMAAGCGTSRSTGLPTLTPTVEVLKASSPESGWPRKVETSRGTVVIKEKPRRIHTLSVGLDEITFALVGVGRVAAVGKPTTNPDWSNVADMARQVGRVVGRDAEEVLAANPDLVVATPFVKEDLLRALEAAGVTVVVADLHGSLEGHERNIRLLGYIYGEEERAERLVREVQERLARIDAVVSRKSLAERPRALMLIGDLYTPGEGANEDGIIRRAGGINVAAEAGIRGNKQLSLESIPGLRPDLLLLVEQEPAAPRLANTVVNHPALQDLPAVRQHRYFPVTHRYVTTLSHWNVRGVEELARVFYPNEFN